VSAISQKFYCKPILCDLRLLDTRLKAANGTQKKGNAINVGSHDFKFLPRMMAGRVTFSPRGGLIVS
jgi:hypothetical protein